MKNIILIFICLPSFIFAQKIKIVQTKYYKSVQLKESYYVLKKNKHIKNGLFHSYYKDGKLHKKGMYILNKKDGEWIDNTKSGTLVRVYKKGRKISEHKTGIWCTFYENKKVEVCFDHDKQEKTPVKFYQPLPKYPDSARENRTQGIVIVQITVNDDFTIKSSHVIKSLSKECDEVSLEFAVNFAKLILKYDKSVVIDNTLNIPITFNLE